MADPIPDAPAPAQAREAPARIDAQFVARVVDAAEADDAATLRSMLEPLHPADIADVVETLPGDALRSLILAVGEELPLEMLLELPEEKREQVLDLLPAAYIGAALGDLDTDDAAAIADGLEAEKLSEALKAASEDVRLAVETGLSFDEETAGRLMQREFVAAPEFWNVGQTIDHLRAAADDDLPDQFYEIYVVDPAFRPVGALALSVLMRARRDTPLRALMHKPEFLVRQEMDQEEVAHAFQRYRLASAPVVDDSGRLAGMVTVDDIVDVVQEEGEEDLLKLAGVSEASQGDSIRRSTRARAPWLILNLLTALTASFVIAAFAQAIEKMVALAVLMPIVSSLGGNAGTQSLAVAVRSLAARDLTPANAASFVRREVMTGAFNGAIIGIVMGVLVGFWFRSPGLALACVSAVIINLTCAGIAGSLIPLGLQRSGADPAVASSVLVTWLTDVIGFLAFLGIASLILLR